MNNENEEKLREDIDSKAVEEEKQNSSRGEVDRANRSPNRIISEPDEEDVRYFAVEQKTVKQKKSGSFGIEKEENPKKRLFKNIGIFMAIVLIVVAVGAGCNVAFIGGSDLPSTDYIATLYVEGTIGAGGTDYFGNPVGYQHQWTLDKIDDLIGDDNNKGMILFVDSPGGGVYESDELYFKIKEYQTYTDRPVYAVMGTMAASGGYYVSAPADKIIANRNTWTGSIGVTIGTLFDFSELLQKYGVKTKTITSGANKAMGSSVDPLTEEQQAIFQGLVDEAYLQFVGLIAQERDMDINKVKKLADGRIYTAKQALELEMIDNIGTFDEAIRDMQQEYRLYGCKVVDVVPKGGGLFGGVLDAVSNIKATELGDLNVVMKLVEEQGEFPISYMYNGPK